MYEPFQITFEKLAFKDTYQSDYLSSKVECYANEDLCHSGIKSDPLF